MTHFDPTKTKFCQRNAIELAKASGLVYKDITGEEQEDFNQAIETWNFDSKYSYFFGFDRNQTSPHVGASFTTHHQVINLLKPVGIEIIPINEVKNNEDTQAFLAGNSKVLVLCFRGTEKIKDWITNLKTDLIEASGHKFHRGFYLNSSKVHRGFYQGLNSIWKDLIKALQKAWDNHQSLFVTGHSLGGALATLAVARLLEEKASHGLEKLQINGLYTFGSPRVGNKQFAATFNQQFGEKTFRFVNDFDIVTQLVLYRKGYRHVGRRVHAESMKPFTLGRLQEEMQVDSWLDLKVEGLFKFRNAFNYLVDLIQDIDDYIEDHSLSKYADLLENAINVADDVSFHETGVGQKMYAQCTALLKNLAKVRTSFEQPNNQTIRQN